ncbi:MAG: PIG-L deacetylase family protein [Actinomycetes bacterium]
MSASPPSLPTGDIPTTSTSVSSRNLTTPERALAIVAHPDDAEFQCGGTLAKWAANGCVINHLVLTDGSKGTWDAQQNTEQLVEQRREEQMEAARRLGSIGKVVMLGHVDGELQPTLHIRDQVAYWIRSTRPDVVLAHDPWKRYRLHPDHRNAGWLALDGIVAARDPHYFAHHGLDVHRPDYALLFEADEPDHVEDITGFVDTKVEALLAHSSQFITTHAIPADDDGSAATAFGERIRNHAAAVGAVAGVDRGEVFKLLSNL